MVTQKLLDFPVCACPVDVGLTSPHNSVSQLLKINLSIDTDAGREINSYIHINIKYRQTHPIGPAFLENRH